MIGTMVLFENKSPSELKFDQCSILRIVYCTERDFNEPFVDKRKAVYKTQSYTNFK